MQRRLINAMDDLKVSEDGNGSVRNTADRIIQFEYGEDGIDPARSRKGLPFDITKVLDDALGVMSDGSQECNQEEIDGSWNC